MGDPRFIGASIATIFGVFVIVDQRPLTMLLSPDQISYLLIAEKISTGDFIGSLNTYWGPLYSWLISLFHFVVGGNFAAVGLMVNAVSAIVLILGVVILGCHLNLTSLPITFLATTSALYGVYLVIASGVDALFAAIYLWCCVYICRLLRENSSILDATVFGLLLGSLYLTKSFGLPLSIISLVTLAAALYFCPGWSNKNVRALGIATIVVGLVCLPWITAISLKVGHITFGTSGAFNNSLFGPDSAGFPMHTAGLIEPGESWMVSAWHEPEKLPVTEWSPFASLSDAGYQAQRFLENIVSVGHQWSWGGVATAGLFISAMFWKLRVQKRVVDISILVIAAISLAYVAGYALVTVQDRYLYGAALSLWVCSFSLALKVWGNSFVLWIIFVAIAGLNISPRVSDYMTVHFPTARYEVARDLSFRLPPDSRIASNTHWHDTLAIAYLNRYEYLGHRGSELTDDQFRSQLEKLNVEYLFCYDGNQAVSCGIHEDSSKVYSGTFEGLSVWRLRIPSR